MFANIIGPCGRQSTVVEVHYEKITFALFTSYHVLELISKLSYQFVFLIGAGFRI